MYKYIKTSKIRILLHQMEVEIVVQKKNKQKTLVEKTKNKN